MKKYVIAALLFICLSQYSFPQNNVNCLTPRKAVRQSEPVLQMDKLFPALPAAAGVHTPYDVLNLPGIRENIPDDFIARLKGNSYVPVKVTIDDNIRINYTYNPDGYLESSTRQTLRDGEWINLDRSSNAYGPDNRVVVFTTEVWENGDWKLVTIQTISYTPEGRPDTVIYKSFPESTLFPTSTRTSYSYDQAGDLSSILKENYKNKTWVNDTRTSYTRNSARLELSCTEESWQESAWYISFKSTNTYNENNLITLRVSKRNEYGVLKDFERQVYTYDNLNHRLSLTAELAVNGILQNIVRYTYGYSGDTRISFTMENWSEADRKWFNSSRSLFSYPGPDIDITITETYNNNAWEASGKLENVYDGNNNLVSKIFRKWNGTERENQERNTAAYDGMNLLWSQVEKGSGQTWINLSRREYKFVDGNAVEGKFLLWQDNTWKPAPGIICMYFNNSANYNYYENASIVRAEYSPATGVENEGSTAAKEFSLSQNYPNPFNPSTTISYSLNKEGNVKLTIYDVLGTKVTELVNEFQSAGSHTIKFNASGLSSGIYLYRLESQGMSAIKKFMYLK